MIEIASTAANFGFSGSGNVFLQNRCINSNQLASYNVYKQKLDQHNYLDKMLQNYTSLYIFIGNWMLNSPIRCKICARWNILTNCVQDLKGLMAQARRIKI